jgi:cell division transport system permease protein
MFTSFGRIAKFALQDFKRNKGISLAAIFVLVVVLLLVTFLLFSRGITDYLVSEIQGKIDITAYFKGDAEEQDILDVKNKILQMSPNIKGIEYISKEQALQIFNERHEDNPVLSRALQEVGANPFLPSLNIITSGDPVQYAEVSNILQTSDFSKLIDKVDFSQKKTTIEKVYSATKSINLFGFIVGAVLIIIAISVVFNTVKLAVENSKDEISTMRIVGASDWFVRGPFIIQGVIYGIFAFLICALLSLLFAYLFSAKISVILPGFSLFGYFLTNFWFFALIQLVFGVGVGGVCSYIVVKKYLEI